MRALRCHGNGDLRVEDVAARATIAPASLVAKPSLCGIGGTDLPEYAAGPLIVPTACGRGPSPAGRQGLDPAAVLPTDDYHARRGLGPLSDRNATIGLSWPGAAWANIAPGVRAGRADRMGPQGHDDRGRVVCYPVTIWLRMIALIALIASARLPVERLATRQVPPAVEQAFAPLLQPGTPALTMLVVV